MKRVWLDYIEADGSVNTLYPRSDYAHADSSSSGATLVPETSEGALAAWIETRRANGLPGAVRLQSKTDTRNGLYAIAKVRVQ